VTPGERTSGSAENFGEGGKKEGGGRKAQGHSRDTEGEEGELRSDRSSTEGEGSERRSLQGGESDEEEQRVESSRRREKGGGEGGQGTNKSKGSGTPAGGSGSLGRSASSALREGGRKDREERKKGSWRFLGRKKEGSKKAMTVEQKQLELLQRQQQQLEELQRQLEIIKEQQRAVEERSERDRREKKRERADKEEGEGREAGGNPEQSEKEEGGLVMPLLPPGPQGREAVRRDDSRGRRDRQSIFTHPISLPALPLPLPQTPPSSSLPSPLKTPNNTLQPRSPPLPRKPGDPPFLASPRIKAVKQARVSIHALRFEEGGGGGGGGGPKQDSSSDSKETPKMEITNTQGESRTRKSEEPLPSFKISPRGGVSLSHSQSRSPSLTPRDFTVKRNPVEIPILALTKSSNEDGRSGLASSEGTTRSHPRKRSMGSEVGPSSSSPALVTSHVRKRSISSSDSMDVSPRSPRAPSPTQRIRLTTSGAISGSTNLGNHKASLSPSQSTDSVNSSSSALEKREGKN
jgi:hypothetical protein